MVDGCASQRHGRGWCIKHYKRWLKHGDPLFITPVGSKESVETRFWMRVDKSTGYGCWNWRGAPNNTGYGGLTDGRRSLKAHRYSYELLRGPIPEGLQVDHTCFNKMCVNPEHLRVVTNKQNSENQRLQSNNTSGVLGVSWAARVDKWLVQVIHHGVNHYGGVYSDIMDAEKAAIALRNTLFTHNDADRGVTSC